MVTSGGRWRRPYRRSSGPPSVPGRIPLSRVFAWFADPQGSLRFSSWKRLLATAALEPFLNLNPSDETKRALAAFLCRTIGHPILHSSAWYDIDSQLRDVLLRWLVQTSFEDFFRLVDRTAGNPEHWVARRNFWYSYLKNNLIDDAWLILGPAASARLDPRGRANLNAGSLRRGAGTDSTHSALLLKIRGITIAEFSHNRKCRIWLRGNRAAPKLYEREYDYASLTDGCNEEIPHYGSQNYRWQARISSIIEEHTGIADPGRRGK
ncbi:MAG: EH signature domain-containing protein [Xanthomonadales bacterium]|nr:EH signature domain-containing protein [Xanthomonadales bacterium]